MPEVKYGFMICAPGFHGYLDGPTEKLDQRVGMTIIMVMAQPPFTLIYDTEVAAHLSAIESKYHSLIRNTIDEQLSYEPEVATRN